MKAKSQVQISRNYEMKEIFKIIFSNSFFIFFSFANLFIPFYTTIISSLLGPHGVFNVLPVGLTISFISVFNQFLFLLALALVFIFNNNSLTNIDKMIVDKHSIWSIMFIYEIISLVLFVTTASVYLTFSNIYQNIVRSTDFGYKFIGITSLSLLFNGFIYLNIFFELEKNKKKAILIYALFFVFHLIFIPLFYLPIPWPIQSQTIGLSLGYIFSSLLSALILLVINRKSIFFSMKFNKESFKSAFLKTNNFVVNFLLATVMKMFLVMVIALTLDLNSKETPLALPITKIIWYNSLFFCGFFGDGLYYAIEYSKMKSVEENKNPHVCLKTWFILGVITFVVTMIISIIFSFIALELPRLYVSHQMELINDPVMGMVEVNTPHVWESIQKYLWSPNSGALNISLMQLTHKPEYTSCFALLYLGIYHCFINFLKILSISKLKLNEKFNWKKLISNFILLLFVMVFITVFGVSFNSFEGFLRVFNGVDGFSFALMLISLMLTTPTLIGFINGFIKMNKHKKLMTNNIDK